MITKQSYTRVKTISIIRVDINLQQNLIVASTLRHEAEPGRGQHSLTANSLRDLANTLYLWKLLENSRKNLSMTLDRT